MKTMSFWVGAGLLFYLAGCAEQVSLVCAEGFRADENGACVAATSPGCQNCEYGCNQGVCWDCDEGPCCDQGRFRDAEWVCQQGKNYRCNEGDKKPCSWYVERQDWSMFCSGKSAACDGLSAYSEWVRDPDCDLDILCARSNHETCICAW